MQLLTICPKNEHAGRDESRGLEASGLTYTAQASRVEPGDFISKVEQLRIWVLKKLVEKANSWQNYMSSDNKRNWYVSHCGRTSPFHQLHPELRDIEMGN